MERQTLARFRWVILIGGGTVFAGMAWFLVPFHYPGPLAVFIGTVFVSTKGFCANRELRRSGLEVDDIGICRWLRTRDWSAVIYCAAFGGITAITLYCLSRIAVRVTAPIMTGLEQHSP